ncbi:MAG: bifunctional UDP-N-acetylglucosamine diphosphorylase/glucosamine-1-phosphate N-acetyltransferase GlmU [Nitrospirae bacterium]|nr:bifunctional UDP-N-acetylglucosamine diphosphorylase/glucosamine-1-phosphate N-acetyltransferase GlmU [Nitrospirota bacterium]
MKLSVVILAAGRGKRMKSRTPKILHEALGRPMVQYVIDAVKTLKPAKTIVVVGNGAEEVKGRIDDGHMTFVLQKELLGTGDALAIARKELLKGTVLVLNGDCPLIKAGTLKSLLAKHRRSKNVLSFLSFIDESMSGYGRIIRDGMGKVTGIVEDKHASPDERKMFNELNGGVYVMESETIGHLDKIKKNSLSGEYYLTDIIGIISRAGKRLDAYQCPSEEIRGVNSREELYEISTILKRRVISGWMKKGVTFIDPETAQVHVSASIGRDTIIYPNTYIEGRTSIGPNCTIYPGARIYDSVLGKGVTIKDNTLIEKSRVRDGASVGPCAHLRPDSIIGRNAKIGNFVEVKKSHIGAGTKAGHLTYLGDAEIGPGVNIGAGTITCNYDGKNKFKTYIKSGVFIGSDSQLVAPVTIEKNAYVAAGSTITRDVPSGALAIGRGRQKNLEGWTKREKGANSKESGISNNKKKKS